jgi:hypothetical protein
MSDEYYDSKGIKHYGVFAEQDAESANRRYLREEEAATKKSLDLQRQQAEAGERTAREAELARLGQEAHSRRMERLKEAELGEQRKLAQFQKDVAFLEGEKEEAKLDYLTRRSLQDCGPEKGIAAEYGAPLENHFLRLLGERIDHSPEVAKLVRDVAEQRRKSSDLESRLQVEKAKVRELTPDAAVWANSIAAGVVTFIVAGVVGLVLYSNVFSVDAGEADRLIIYTLVTATVLAVSVCAVRGVYPKLLRISEDRDSKLRSARLNVLKLTVESQRVEKELDSLTSKQDAALKKLKDKLFADTDFSRTVKSLVSQEDHAREVRCCVERFQESLPNRCRINPALVSVKWCEPLYHSLLDELVKCAKEIVEGAVLQGQCPAGKRLFTEDGKSFYYEKGHRIYVDTAEVAQRPNGQGPGEAVEC